MRAREHGRDEQMWEDRKRKDRRGLHEWRMNGHHTAHHIVMCGEDQIIMQGKGETAAGGMRYGKRNNVRNPKYARFHLHKESKTTHSFTKEH
jgi:hypothetical protein